jgi:hypothetical protein
MPRPPKHPDGAAILANTRLLSDLLDTDVQGYAPRLAEIDEALADVAKSVGSGKHVLRGNVYTLTVTPSGAEIVNARDGKVPHERIPLAEFEAAFRAWRAARRTP